MKWVLNLVLVASLVSVAQAGTVNASSYDMRNGQTGTYTYWDDSYTGSGSTTTSLAVLSGGLGDLTDGVVATQNWFNTPGRYVGWYSIDPVITFHFATDVAIDSVQIWVDDANGHGGVRTPASAHVSMGTFSQTFSISDPAGSAPFSVSFDTTGAVGNSLALTLNRRGGGWVFLSEVAFEGAAVPLPPAAFLGLGLLGGVGLIGRLRKRRSA